MDPRLTDIPVLSHRTVKYGALTIAVRGKEHPHVVVVHRPGEIRGRPGVNILLKLLPSPEMKTVRGHSKFADMMLGNNFTN